MSSQPQDDEFRELELYLEKTKEEIGETIFQQADALADMDGSTASMDPDLQSSQCDQMLDDLEDILCHYDNMEFYNSNNQKGNTRSKESVTQLQNGNNNLSSDRNVPEQGKPSKIFKNDIYQKGTRQKHVLSNRSIDLKHEKQFKDRKISKFDSPVPLLSRSCESSGIHGSLLNSSKPDKKHGMDDWKNYNLASKATKNNPPDRLTKSEILHPSFQGHLDRESSLIGNGPLVQNTHVQQSNMQIDDDLSPLGKVKGNEHDTVDGHVGFWLDRNKQSQGKLDIESMDVKFEINDLIEKINDSIDELIGGDPRKSGEKKDGSAKLDNDDKSSVDASESKRNTCINVSKSEVDNVNLDVEGNIANMESKEEDDVVETDFGFYWVTATIDEKVNVHKAESNESIHLQNRLSGSGSICSSNSDTLKRFSSSDKPTDSESIGSSNSDTLKRLSSSEKPLDYESIVNEKLEALKRHSDSDKPTDSESIVSSNSDTLRRLHKPLDYESIVNAKLEALKRHSGTDKPVDSESNISDNSEAMECRGSASLNNSYELSDDSRRDSTGMITSAPNFLSLDRTVLRKQRLSRQDNHQSTSDENLPKVLKRKYSAPPSFGRVYKVVSVDIPKMEYSKSVKKPCRFGDASKALKASKSKSSSSEKPVSDKVDSASAKSGMETEDSVDITRGLSKQDSVESSLQLEPPPMFQDKKDQTEEMANIHIGPILAPPPAFASNEAMDTSSAPTRPPVWDPGVTTVTQPANQREPGRAETPPPPPPPRLPQTPPLPSAASTERLISSALSRHKQRKLSSGESNFGQLKVPGSPRPRSADSAYSDRVKYDLNGNEKQNKNEKICFRKSDTSDLHSVKASQQKNYLNISKFSNKNENMGVQSSKANDLTGDSVQRKNSKVKSDSSKNKLDLIDKSNHPGKVVKKNSKKLVSSAGSAKSQKMLVSMATETTQSHSQDNKGVNKKSICEENENGNTKAENSAKADSSPVYATISKSAKVNNKSNKKQELPKKQNDSPSNIPKKPKSLPGELIDGKEFGSFDSDHSEYQVMFNSLSPVLMRRRPSKSGRKGGSVETSPESTPSVSPRLDNQGNTDSKPTNLQSSENALKPSESLFMDPAMAQTWHGATSSNWSHVFGPQLRAMMRDLEKGDPQSYEDAINQCAETFERNSKTLPSKSLLDEMHKKFCADQYMDSRDADVARALVLLRLKSPTPGKPRRSKSFNIRMGTHGRKKGAAEAATAESSPMMPRVSERIRIKTRPDFQYSPKPRRAITPEPTTRQMQDQCSRKEEAEIEAIEACRWLRETGFPQYAQLYEDGQFPVDIESVEKDHDFLDKEDIQSLFRRLNTLNKCAIMKIGTPTKKEAEDSDEEDQCALSDKWKYQRSSRRWSRKDLDSPSSLLEGSTSPGSGSVAPGLRSASSHDSLLADQTSSSETGDSPVLDTKMMHINDNMLISKSGGFDSNGNANMGLSPVIRRAASERIKGAKSFLRRMESLKGRKSKKNKTITEISGPVINKADMQAKIKHLNCTDLHPSTGASSDTGATPSASVSTGDSNELHGSSISANSVDLASSQSEAVTVVSPMREDNPALPGSLSLSQSASDKLADASAMLSNGAQGLDISTLSQQSNSSENTNSLEDSLFTSDYRPGRFPTKLDDSLFIDDSNIRHRSYSYTDDVSKLESKLRRGSHDPRHQMHRISIYDNVPIEEDLTVAQQELDIILSELFQNINGLNKAINGEDAELLEPPVSGIFDDTSLSVDSHTPENERSTDTTSDTTHEADELPEALSGTLSSPDISDHELQHEETTSHDDSAEHIVVRERRDSGVGSSLTRTNSDRRKYRIRWHSFQKSHRPTSENRNTQLCSLSAGQILLLRKLSLLKLTALIEKYSPNRTGWSLTVPRFMKRNKAPDYKDKNVFGVPFAVMIHRTGQALPQCILHAMRFLRRTAEDALGIFRKSGVRSRIQKLRNDIEANPEAINFEDLQAYDVADLVKQYFRELPECLLTNKLSDMFISIFIYVPAEYRLEALQAAVVLMADENRDVLQSLLLFLSDIAKQHSKHQMTASNLAVCFAPSLFMGNPRNASSTPSPRRNRKATGIPDARELMEQKAAHECLTMMIQECKKIFTIPAGTLSKCRVWHGDPQSLEELSRSVEGNQGYQGHIDSCIQGLLKESREKFRGWISVPVHVDVDVSYKKVGDGHPLRLYKCTTEVEAPPTEVLNRVLKDRQTWDEDLLQWHTVQTLDNQTEVFQYVRNSMAPHPTREYCVLRSWRTDLPKGACVLISMSIEHPDAELKGGLTVVELASRYLIEPCGTGKSRLTHISRVDLKGHSPDWYKKVYGHICANFVEKIRASFHCNTEGPETKV